MDSTRINCPMRHDNGNCLPCGGVCLAVSNEICRGLRNAYRDGANSWMLKQEPTVSDGKWIPVSERRPQDFVSVLGYMPDAYPFPSVRECYGVGYGFYFPALREIHQVSHWMPMPEL